MPHQFTKKEDIEIAGFLTATIAWGNRKSIIKNANQMIQLLENSPHDFIINHKEQDLEPLLNFVHRTFNGSDFIQFIKSLQHIYKNYEGLEAVFAEHAKPNSMQESIHQFKRVFFEMPHLARTQKHISDPLKNSAAKRINIFKRIIIAADN